MGRAARAAEGGGSPRARCGTGHRRHSWASAGHERDLRSSGRTLLLMTVRTSGVRQQSIWASVVSDDAQNLRGWLLGLGFTEELLIPGEGDGHIHHCQLDWPEGGR